MPRRIRRPLTPKQRFEEYERSIRVGDNATAAQRRAANTIIQNTWAARAPVDRITIRDLVIAALDADSAWGRRDAFAFPIHNNVVTYLNNLNNQREIGEELDSGRHKAAIEEDRRNLASLRRVQVAASNAWIALEQEHIRQQPNSDAISTNAANAQWNLANNAIVNTDNRLLWLQSRLDSPRVPSNAAGVRRVRKWWLPTESFRRWRFGQDQAAILPPVTIVPDAGPIVGGWTLHRQVGVGGQGTASLWLGFDANNRVSRRVVRKTVDESQGWYDARRFAGDDVRDVNNRIPWEFECHQDMERARLPHHNLARNDHIVALGATANPALVNNFTNMYRIYTEWCPGGDLDSIIAHYRNNILPPQPIPEPFIWAVAEALTLAGIAMQTGFAGEAALPGWEPIVHRDLKPSNVFLGNLPSAPNPWQCYPIIRLGDFGLAVKPNAYGASNPESWQDVGTPRFLAPEQMNYVNRNTNAPMNPWPLNEQTNVFGVGVILYCLVTQQRSPAQAYWLGDGAADTTYTLEDPTTRLAYVHQPFAATYTTRLRRFIDACTQFDPGNRRDFQAMRLDLQTTFDPVGLGESALWTRGMRSGTAHGAIQDAEQLFGVREDTYQLNMVRPVPP